MHTTKKNHSFLWDFKAGPTFLHVNTLARPDGLKRDNQSMSERSSVNFFFILTIAKIVSAGGWLSFPGKLFSMWTCLQVYMKHYSSQLLLKEFYDIPHSGLYSPTTQPYNSTLIDIQEYHVTGWNLKKRPVIGRRSRWRTITNRS